MYRLCGQYVASSISWRFKIRRVEGRWSMYDAISDHLPMLLAVEDAIYVLQPSLDGGFRILIGRCSSNDAYLLAIYNASCRGYVANM